MCDVRKDDSDVFYISLVEPLSHDFFFCYSTGDQLVPLERPRTLN